MAGEPPCFNLPIEATVYLGLGTNLGDREENLRRALRAISEFAEIEAVSRVYETEPVGYADQPDFWNVVTRVRTAESPRQLFTRLKEIESGLGRTSSFRNAPRIIDIDILTYDACVIEDADLQIPHPRMHQRSFVLAPFAELDPTFVHPSLREPIHDLLQRLDTPTRALPLEAVTLKGIE